MISHQFEERWIAGLGWLGVLTLAACYIYLVYLFCTAWAAKNIVDMIGYGVVLCLLSPGGKK